MAAENRYAQGCAWVEGRYVPIAEARIPILDTGFTRSDLTYDVAAVWQGRFFRLGDHLDRLLAGCRRLRITSPASKEDIAAICTGTCHRPGIVLRGRLPR